MEILQAAILLLVLALYFAWVTGAGLLWLAIYILERDNPNNRFLYALGWSAINIGVQIGLVPFGILGLGAVVIYGIAVVWALNRYYELAIVKAIGVIALVVATPMVVQPRIVEFTGHSALRALLILIGVPTAILVGWLLGRRRWRRSAADQAIPQARVVAAKPPRAITQPAPDEIRPSAAPIRPSQPIIPRASSAPTAEPQASPSDGPRFLR